MKEYSKFAAMLSTELSLYLVEHDKNIPVNSLVIFEVKGEDGFNKWHHEVSMKSREGQYPTPG